MNTSEQMLTKYTTIAISECTNVIKALTVHKNVQHELDEDEIDMKTAPALFSCVFILSLSNLCRKIFV